MERLPSEVAKASKELPSQQRRQICINGAVPADFYHHSAKEFEPLAIIDRQSPRAVALHVLSAYLPLTSLGRIRAPARRGPSSLPATEADAFLIWGDIGEARMTRDDLATDSRRFSHGLNTD